MLLTVGGVSATKPAHATAPPLALDGIGTNTTCQAANCEAQFLTTTQGYDVVLLLAECGYTYCPITISSIIDSSGLTFTQRVSYTPSDKLWEYYARTTSPLKSDNITVVFSCISYCFGLHGIQALAIQGANTRGIFDPSPSIPATCASPTCDDCTAYDLGTSCSVSIQTSTQDFVIAITAINDAGPCGARLDYQGVQGFTTLTTNPGYAGNFEIDYAITTTPQNNIVFSCKGTDAWAIVVDAISFRGAFGI